ncbi:MAG: substrate-binding domain-containing protein [Akkermansiaceae bacterium]|nr:substrate-binding domain-containing protein [Akkermansiaceae bacterium]MCP5543926.1 substrate-binding domain-containing protein [Akkermansiaceae bacterium]MCP5547558.1 substrate-binding domain-containing protein [Akkermansiaceae bacterium]
MGQIERKTAAEIAADAIQAELQAGRWTGTLPGTRILSLELGVSAPTISVALGILEKQGLLARGGERKAYRIRTSTSGPRETKKTNRMAAILTHANLGSLPHTTRRVIEETRTRLHRSGWRTEIRTFDFLHAKRPHRSWDKLVPTDQEVPLIAVFGRPAIAEWAEARGRRMIFLGGVTGNSSIPTVGVKSSFMVDEAMRRLTQLGHRRIVMPLCDRAPVFTDSLKDAMRGRLEDAGVAFVPNYHAPESEYLQPEVTWSMMESAFRLHPPTAIITLDWKEMVTVGCFLASRDLKVPRDVSLVVLNEQLEAEWFVPKLACFRFPTSRLAKALSNWVTGKELTIDSTKLRADFDEGESIARAAG